MKSFSNKEQARAAIVFLDRMGLTIEDKEEIMAGERLKVFTRDNQEMGHITFYEDEIDIRTQTDLGFLHAYYERPKITSFEDGDMGSIKHQSWKNNIQYTLQRDNIVIKGEYLMDISMDSEFGNRCVVHPTLSYYQNDQLLFDLLFLRNGKAFSFHCYNQGLESFELKPFSNESSPLWHEVKRGKEGSIDRETWWISVNKKANTLTASYVNDEQKEGTYHDKAFSYDIVSRVSEDAKEERIQQGKLMQTLDPGLYKRILEIQSKLTCGKISLFDCFVNDTLSSYRLEEIEALLGICPQKNERLTHYYFPDDKSKVKVYTR